MRNKQYKYKLTPISAAEGIRLANENAFSLLKDAELLYDNNRFERCVALSILAIEELGKSSIIRSILLTDDPKELKKEWQNYRKHTEKNISWIVPELISKGAKKLEDFRIINDPKNGHGQTLDSLKQLAFYTDAITLKKWSTPHNVIDKELAKDILYIAKIMSKKGDDVIDNEKMLELWVKHMRPVWKSEMSEMKQGLINYYLEAETLELISVGKAKKMIDFLN